MDYKIRRGIGKPLRSFKEMAEEFGVSCNTLAGYSKGTPLPAPKLKHIGARVHCNTWYDPDEMRSWWKKVQDGKP